MNPTQTLTKTAVSVASRGGFAERLQMAIKNSDALNRPFFIVLIQIRNMSLFSNKHPVHIIRGLVQETYQKVRRVVHPSQYVAPIENGVGIIFEGLDAGHVDSVSKKLATITYQVIRDGRYNDINSRWSDIIAQFLYPGKGFLISPMTGWSIYPRDGATPLELITRAVHHTNREGR